ncbi:DEAD/DEAH box helicase [Tessaracoccus sp. SD287]|uniref:DEAD/DEAH box helicase n=1 Tax=Tessaracoccus sp. SD287 TaxID=2782008 RepID=UPI001A977E5B|nr:DEAD/DEAH box helicase [Tessaracoccus sp. SD287]
MDWQQEEVVDLDTSGVDHEGGFSTLGLPDEIVAMLTKRGINEPFPIQVATIPDALAGRDVLGRARTGSGKTLAFSLPVVTRLSQDPEATHTQGGRRTPRALVLVPTRELALQVADVLSPLAASLGLKLVLVAGGMPYGPQTKAFDRGVDIVVATPGRLIDLLEQGAADLSNVQITVLDEADHMADLGFMPAVTTLLDAVSEGGQKLLFSATLDGAVDRLVKKYMNTPALHEVDSGKASVTTMRHEVFLVKPHDKVEVTARIANREGRTVIFARTQLGTDRVAAQLREAGVMAGSLHGGLTQGARARMLAAFKEGTLPVLVATDVAARGIHVDEVSLVLQIDPPMNGKDYTHRAGRTARAGSEGAVISIVLPHQRRQTLRMIGSTGVKVDPVDIRPDDEALVNLTGAAEPTGEPITDDQLKVLVAPRQTARRPRPEGGRGGYDNKRGGGFNRGGSRGGGFNRGGSGSGGGYRGNKGGYGKPRVAEAGGWNRDN